MLILCRFSTIGLHLLLLCHIAHTFVLLTANIDDVKKLAGKFVSNDVAKKIAKFLKSASLLSTKIVESSKSSEESSKRVSEENSIFHVGRQGDDEVQENNKDKTLEHQSNDVDNDDKSDSTQEKESHKDISQERQKRTERPEKPKKTAKSDKLNKISVGRLEGPSLYVVEGYPMTDEAKTTTKASKISLEDEKYEEESKQLKEQESKYLDRFETTKLDLQSFLNTKIPRKIKGHPYKLLSMNSVQDNMVSNTNMTLEENEHEFHELEKAMDNLTTKKTLEYDQYYNPTFSASTPVASGSESLDNNMSNDKKREMEFDGDNS